MKFKIPFKNNISNSEKIIIYTSLIMILIHILGCVYQLITKAPIWAIILKIIYIVLFTILIIKLSKRDNFAKITTILLFIMSIISIFVSHDFLSILVIIYISYNLYLSYGNTVTIQKKETNKKSTKNTKIKNK